MSKEEIKKIIISKLKEYGVIKASLFGSLARNDNTENSDVDLLVEFKKGSSLLDLSGLKIELEEILKKKVDIITYKSVHPLLKEYIFKDEELIYG